MATTSIRSFNTNVFSALNTCTFGWTHTNSLASTNSFTFGSTFFVWRKVGTYFLGDLSNKLGQILILSNLEHSFRGRGDLTKLGGTEGSSDTNSVDRNSFSFSLVDLLLKKVCLSVVESIGDNDHYTRSNFGS